MTPAAGNPPAPQDPLDPGRPARAEPAQSGPAPGPVRPIIIFGAALRPDGTPTQGLRNRVGSAVAIGRTLDNALYIPTGGVPRAGVTEAEVMQKLLRQAGVPDRAILPEPTAGDTLASVKICCALLNAFAPPPAGPILVATSPFHQPRCLLLMRLAGWPARAVPFTASAQTRTSVTKRLWRVLHELVATPWDALLILAWRIVQR
ncbi:YdcF family protein [Acetobacter sp. TBRC 12305]|uniref:YdcF family protein n=1 Tax=Acetobacter garciniae TaxID=2817435 RepID=A0A939HIQ3_9PROT|nr:YdcF family protein [Acetobacter garciniae]MBO1324167.1 YdcF family protein [Acetobacter garciniae]MBX0343856.1 YdcF family protein [Acetobacter garciniae]